MIEAIYDAVFFVAYLGFFLGYGAVWLVVPTLIVYALLYRLKRKEWKIPCDLLDIPTLIIPCCIWYHFMQHDGTYRGAGWFVDLIATGAVYGIFFLIRTIVIWFRPQWRCKASLLMFVLTTVAILIFALTGICGKAN